MSLLSDGSRLQRVLTLQLAIFARPVPIRAAMFWQQTAIAFLNIIEWWEFKMGAQFTVRYELEI